jgi:hypothetical protein
MLAQGRVKVNERIRSIERESGLEIYGLGLDRAKWEAAMTKFAELIVRECIRELEISRKCDPYTGDLFDCEYNTCIKEQSIMLKEHFGVEE